ncbi:hypothetical protein DdX_10152 [Ditylenchus destructor]|uniref:Uncharacterized protein n=1 Tax=Ditylenchus destructor TaxID=166010 RepID=A0AAD4R5M2_9BILA|nr:hypothetical protein DdX_10152 [Ditylenchus destructor]
MACASLAVVTFYCLTIFASSIVLGAIDDPDCLKSHSLVNLPDDCIRTDATVINEDYCSASLDEIKCWDGKTMNSCETEVPSSLLVENYYSADLQAYESQGAACKELKTRIIAYMDEASQDLQADKNSGH